ncbi:conserved membrane protein of unknown function [Nitrospira sp. KM1]|uniref:DUF2628 domain-containing protein n=1 Tax=Nitrospira sp. KM1 TaxID=1936990 RepID=UPI0013A7349D|nr:DUF2628 domain-containing protein [Nitrospira sp. KM1]BCA55626.1 conserved membrane protein of unknown function [Nitrospira sp. KM1]
MQCRQQNQDDSRFCYQCGTGLSDVPTGQTLEEPTFRATEADVDLWRRFIGPNADRYLQQFKKFGPEQNPKFALTWNWPAFLFISFLWFLYRKMYLYAMVYAIGPMVSAYLTGDMTSGIVWSVMAGATGNYVYFWHCREQIGEIKQKAWNNPAGQEVALKETGGVQSYVIWVGVFFYLLFALVMAKMVQEGPPDFKPGPSKPVKPAASTTT